MIEGEVPGSKDIIKPTPEMRTGFAWIALPDIRQVPLSTEVLEHFGLLRHTRATTEAKRATKKHGLMERGGYKTGGVAFSLATDRGSAFSLGSSISPSLPQKVPFISRSVSRPFWHGYVGIAFQILALSPHIHKFSAP